MDIHIKRYILEAIESENFDLAILWLQVERNKLLGSLPELTPDEKYMVRQGRLAETMVNYRKRNNVSLIHAKHKVEAYFAIFNAIIRSEPVD